MVSTADDTANYRSDQPFFVRLSIFLSLLIAFGFAQFAARGYVDIAQVPVWVHLHALLMLVWLALFVTQNRLAASGNLALHRKLGWISAYLVVLLVGLGCFNGIMAIKLGRVPPIFTPPYFLALTQVGSVVFGGMVFAAITRRKQTDYHRRLMMGALIGITDPALGRILPMPLMTGWAGWAVLAVQLLFIAIMALHDRRVLGRVHPATATAGSIIAMTHVLVALAGINPYIGKLAAAIAAG